MLHSSQLGWRASAHESLKCTETNETEMVLEHLKEYMLTEQSTGPPA